MGALTGSATIGADSTLEICAQTRQLHRIRLRRGRSDTEDRRGRHARLPVITGFASGDTIDLAAVGYDSGGSAMLVGGDLLEITEGGTDL